MCGIAGTSKLTASTRKILPILEWEMSRRGEDSWGMSDGLEVVKKSGSILDSFDPPPENWNRVVYHTRSATHGSAKTVENAHPFQFSKADGSIITGVHNGMIRNHIELGKKYERNFEVDSMHIFAHLSEDRSLTDLEGYAALVWFEENRDSSEMYFSRHNTTDMHIVTLEGGELVFCSLLTPLEKSSKMMNNPIWKTWRIDTDHKYRLITDQDGMDMVEDCGEFKFGAPIVYSSPTYNSNGGGYSDNRHFQGWNPQTQKFDLDAIDEVISGKGVRRCCWICQTTVIDTSKLLMCEECLKKEYEDYKRDSQPFKEVNVLTS
jgi:predicted glutamine amidotransferase